MSRKPGAGIGVFPLINLVNRLVPNGNLSYNIPWFTAEPWDRIG